MDESHHEIDFLDRTLLSSDETVISAYLSKVTGIPVAKMISSSGIHENLMWGFLR